MSATSRYLTAPGRRPSRPGHRHRNDRSVAGHPLSRWLHRAWAVLRSAKTCGA